MRCGHFNPPPPTMAKVAETTTRAWVKLFADDSKIYQSIRIPSDAQLLQTDLDMAFPWSIKWLLPLNEAKCSTLYFG